MIFVTYLDRASPMPVIRISKRTSERLSKYKDSPLDTVGSVIERLLDTVEGNEPKPSKGTKTMRIATKPTMRAARNIESWKAIEGVFATNAAPTYEQLVKACGKHRHESGGRGFVEYCIDSGWLDYAD